MIDSNRLFLLFLKELISVSITLEDVWTYCGLFRGYSTKNNLLVSSFALLQTYVTGVESHKLLFSKESKS